MSVQSAKHMNEPIERKTRRTNKTNETGYMKRRVCVYKYFFELPAQTNIEKIQTNKTELGEKQKNCT